MRRAAIERAALDAVMRLRPGESVDVMTTIGPMLPADVIGELLGIPREDRTRIHRLADRLMPVIHGSLDRDSEDEHAASDAARDLVDYMTSLTVLRRRQPADDVISYMLGRGDERDISNDQVVAASVELIFGGHETTINAIGSLFWVLGSRPDVTGALAEGSIPVETTIEELLRFESPIKGIGRLCVEDMRMSGVEIAAGQNVFLAVMSANRDSDAFENPDVFIPTRDPNPHMAFGRGRHFCLGAPLVRLELEALLTATRPVLPYMRLVTTEPSWRPTVVNRGLLRLDVRLDEAAPLLEGEVRGS